MNILLIARAVARTIQTWLVVSFVLVTAPSAAWADGPVDATSLPGGVVVADSDPGPGEQWGRAGGRDIEYQVLDSTQFSQLSFGVVNATRPGAAFDNSIDGSVDPGEIMTFNSAGSDLPGGIAQWTGSARISLTGLQLGTYTLPTRFTLTVTDDLGAPVPLGSVTGEVDPGIDVLSDTNDTFNVNLFFEAFYPVAVPTGSMIGAGDDTWRPLLDLFDLLDTGISQDGFAHSTVSTGFYFTNGGGGGGGGLSLEQHDETVNVKLDEIHIDTDFLATDWVGRIPAIQNRQVEIENLIRNLRFLLTGDIDSAADRVQEEVITLVLTLWGILPCPPGEESLCDQFSLDNQLSVLSTQESVDTVIAALNALAAAGFASQESVDALQAAVNALAANSASQASVNALQAAVDAIAADLQDAAGGEVRVEVVEISNQSTPNHRQWLVKTTQKGELVDASLTRLLAIKASGGAVPGVDDVTAMATITRLDTGLQDVFLQVTPNVNRDTGAYQFEVEVAGETAAHGSALVDSRP